MIKFIDKLNNNKDKVSFHMPGHKGSAFFVEKGYGDEISRLVDGDITEIPGADNLFNAQGVIRGIEARYEKLYGAKKTYLLVNGSSGGIIAAILSSVKRGGKLILGRNCHKAVFNGMSLGDISPVYVFPEESGYEDISGAPDPREIEKCLIENPEAEAVMIVSPTYHGVVADIEKISEIVHKHGKLLIVDQAHGAHLKFFDVRRCDDVEQRKAFDAMAAENLGADIVIASTHKTMASFTQSAILNVMSDRVDLFELEDKLQAVESSSPSYILMASLDINARICEEELKKFEDKTNGETTGEIVDGNDEGRNVFERWQRDLRWVRQEINKIPGIEIIDDNRFDEAKINISIDGYGISGKELYDLLCERYDIIPEMYSSKYVLLETGIGNVRRDYERLVEALKDIMNGMPEEMAACEDSLEEMAACEGSLEEMAVARDEKALQPRSSKLKFMADRKVASARSGRKELVSIEECAGRICAESIIPYPPGVPYICPGEIFEEDDLPILREMIEGCIDVLGVKQKDKVLVFA